MGDIQGRIWRDSRIRILEGHPTRNKCGLFVRKGNYSNSRRYKKILYKTNGGVDVPARWCPCWSSLFLLHSQRIRRYIMIRRIKKRFMFPVTCPKWKFRVDRHQPFFFTNLFSSQKPKTTSNEENFDFSDIFVPKFSRKFLISFPPVSTLRRCYNVICALYK